MKLRYALPLAACCAAPAVAKDPAADAAAATVLRQALDAQGGEALLRQVQTIAFDASGYRNMLEQSERPEGPWLVEFLEQSELHDHPHHALRRQLQTRPPAPEASYTMGTVVAGGAAMQSFNEQRGPGGSDAPRLAAETLALSPERVLLSALDAPDAHLERDTIVNGVPHQVVGFTLDGAPAHIYLSRYTHLPSAVDYAGPAARSGYAGYLGDVTQRTAWSFWLLDKSGLRYPMQWDVRINGLPDRTLMLRALKVDAPYDPALLAIPDAVAARFDPKAPPRDAAGMPLGAKKTEIAPGVLLIEGAWNSTIIDQGDGLVVLEAPISSSYSSKVLAEAEARFPGKPVKAVVTTSDSWPHLAGLREYAARGIPIYALDLSEPIVRRTLAASYASHPDSLQRKPRAPLLRLVDKRTVIGAGPNRIELAPIRGATSERQMLAWLPGHKLLYGSDPFQRDGDGVYSPAETVDELLRAAEREHLQVEDFFMMHVGPRPWAELTAQRRKLN